MDPRDFLILTTDSGQEERIFRDSRTLKEYNDYTRSGKAIRMPWLYVTLDGIVYPHNSPMVKLVP